MAIKTTTTTKKPTTTVKKPTTGMTGYNPMTYKDATAQANKELDPMYQQSVKAINAQKHQNQLQAGSVAQAKGLSHSGLAADQLTKISLGAQGQIADLNAQKSAQTAQMAREMMNRDEDVQFRNAQFEYQKSRDKVADSQFNQTLAWEKAQYKSESDWRKHTYKNMSASEKAALDWSKKQYGEEQAWRLYEMQYNGEMALSQNQATIDGYNAMDFLP